MFSVVCWLCCVSLFLSSWSCFGSCVCVCIVCYICVILRFCSTHNILVHYIFCLIILCCFVYCCCFFCFVVVKCCLCMSLSFCVSFYVFCFMHACMLLFVFVARRPPTLSQNPYGVCPSRLGWAGLGWLAG